MAPKKPKSVTPPSLPPAAATPIEIAPEAMKAGEAERKRLRGRRGRAGTRLTRPGLMAPAMVERAGLKQKLG